MNALDLPVRHAPPRIDEREADERASRSTGTAGVDWVRRRVWVPFWLHRRKTALAPGHPYADIPLPSPTKLAAGAPPATDDEVIPVASQAVPHVFFPFWHLRGGDAEVLVCATSGTVIRASRGNLRRAEIQRAVAVLALAFFFGSMTMFIADQMVTVALLTMRPLGWWAQLTALVAASCGAALGLTVVVRDVLRPALDESALEIVAGRHDSSAGSHVRRLARWTGRLALFIVVFEVLLVFIQTMPVVPLVLTVIAGAALAYAGHAFGSAGVSPAVLPDAGHEEHSWAVAFRVYAHVLAYAMAGVFANMLLSRAGFYLQAQSVFGRGIESNYGEALLVTAAVVAGVTTSELDSRQRRPLAAGLAVPVIIGPLGGPVAAIVLQFLTVTLVNRSIDRRDARKPLRGTVVRSLETEAGLVAGSLAGRLVALLLMGTSGWAVGSVIGGLVTASLITAPRTSPRIESLPTR